MVLKPSEPPEFLFFATDVSLSDDVFRNGIKGSKTAPVMLYESAFEAKRSAKKIPSLFAVIAKVMAEDGYQFYVSDNGKWCAEEIPSRYIRLQ